MDETAKLQDRAASNPGLNRVRHGLLLRVQKFIDRGWPIVAIRGIYALLSMVLGAYLRTGTLPMGVFLVLIYGLFVCAFEALVFKTTSDIKEDAERQARESVNAELEAAGLKGRRIQEQMETYAEAQEFLARQVEQATEVIASVLIAQPNLRRSVAYHGFRKISLINETLRDLCETLKAIAGKSQAIPLPDAWFRATYMEVRQLNSVDILTYIGWYTPSGTPPRSMSEGKTFERGRGCAGIAWAERRVVIEDTFRPGHEWIDNYSHQGTKYKSMVSVPVLKSDHSGGTTVIGVITVDTCISGYFGEKDNRDKEESNGRMILPYANFIAFISTIDEILEGEESDPAQPRDPTDHTTSALKRRRTARLG